MNKERQAGYAKTYYDKRKAKGDVKATIWLSAAAASALNTAMEKGGKPKEEIINKAIIEMEIE